jgi:hypothetical protein
MTTFTPEAVRDTLLAAGFSESDPQTDLAGFYVKAYPSTIFVTWDAHPATPAEQESRHADYRDALRRAGFRVCVQAGCVPITGLRGEN